ncbi:beta-ketoacyl synthase [Desmospora sp. 8437]|nr:beta-ketoacyl synthase [Desmospora sp. 8437]
MGTTPGSPPQLLHVFPPNWKPEANASYTIFPLFLQKCNTSCIGIFFGTSELGVGQGAYEGRTPAQSSLSS